MEKCKHSGAVIKPNGVDELDPCSYEDIEQYKNVTVTVSKCKNCGHIEFSWEAQDDTVKVL